MTLKTRNSIIAVTLIFSAIITVASMTCFLIIFVDSIKPAMVRRAVPPLLLAVLGCVLGTTIQISFRKTLSAEISLFLVFIALAACDALKPGLVLLDVFHKPIAWSVTLTRIVYFFRFTGIFCFISSGLFASGLPAQRLSSTLGLCFFIAFSLSLIVPVDSSIREDNFLYRLGMHKDIQIAFIALEIVAVINYITAAVLNNEKTYLAAALGAGCALTGRELLFFHHTIFSVMAGVSLFVFGALFYANRIHRIYLWK